MTTTMCLSNGGKHRWKYRDTEQGRARNCAGCGMTQERQPNGRWTQTGSTRWVPLTPAERQRAELTPDTTPQREEPMSPVART